MVGDSSNQLLDPFFLKGDFDMLTVLIGIVIVILSGGLITFLISPFAIVFSLFTSIGSVVSEFVLIIIVGCAKCILKMLMGIGRFIVDNLKINSERINTLLGKRVKVLQKEYTEDGLEIID